MTTVEAFEFVSHVRTVFLFGHALSDEGDNAAYELLADIQRLFIEELHGLRGEQLAQLGEDVLKVGGMAKGTA